MSTLKEVAEACGVSTTTVSNVLNGKSKASEETVKRVLEMVQKMDYRPNLSAKSLRTQHTNIIGIIAEDVKQFTTPFIVESVMAGLEERGYYSLLENLRLYDRWQDQWYDSNRALWSILNPALGQCRNMNVDGIIYIAGHARKITCIPEDYPIPIVMTYAYAMNEHIPSVVISDEESSCEVMRYLLSKGHRNIAVLGGREDNIHTQLRMKGVIRALFEYGIPLNPYLIGYGNWNRASGKAAAEQMKLIEKKVDCVYCMNDEMAAGVYDYFEEHGLQVGKDVSVAGFDDSDIAQYYRPGLTTTALPLREIGRKGAELLCEILSKERVPDNSVYRIPCTLRERGSVAEK